MASHEELKQQRSDDRYRPRVHQRASDLYDDVGGWQRELRRGHVSAAVR